MYPFIYIFIKPVLRSMQVFICDSIKASGTSNARQYYPSSSCVIVPVFPASLRPRKASVYVRGGSCLPIWIHRAVYL